MGNCLKSKKSNQPKWHTVIFIAILARLTFFTYFRIVTLAAFGLDNAGKTSVVKAIKGGGYYIWKT